MASIIKIYEKKNSLVVITDTVRIVEMLVGSIDEVSIEDEKKIHACKLVSDEMLDWKNIYKILCEEKLWKNI